jgi:hypothetical protein
VWKAALAPSLATASGRLWFQLGVRLLGQLPCNNRVPAQRPHAVFPSTALVPNYSVSGSALLSWQHAIDLLDPVSAPTHALVATRRDATPLNAVPG